MELVSRTGGLENGSRLTLRVGPRPFRVTWVAEHRDCEPGRGFRDVQVGGPFALWSHHHRMEAEGAGGCRLVDEVEFQPPLRWLGSGLAVPLLRRKLGRLFRFRHAVTRGDLAVHAAWSARPLRIGVAGGGGPLGSALIHFLGTGGHEVVALPAPSGAATTPLDALVVVGAACGHPGARGPDAAAAPLAGTVVLAGEDVSAPPAERARNVRLARLQLGRVLWPHGGLLRRLRPLPHVRRTPGAGSAPVHWIGLDDALDAILRCVADPELEGTLAAAGGRATLADLDAALAAVEPGLRLPASAAIVSPASEGATIPALRLRHPDLEGALRHVLGAAPAGEPAAGPERKEL